jgi:hypothetical protein
MGYIFLISGGNFKRRERRRYKLLRILPALVEANSVLVLSHTDHLTLAD